MMSKKLFYCIVSLIVSISSNSQKLLSISGKVTDKKSNPISNATIHLLNTNIAALTDAQGNFAINNIAKGSYIAEASAVGYATVSQLINVNANTIESFNIQLEEAYKQLDAVTVTAEKKEESLQQIPVSITSISARQ